MLAALVIGGLIVRMTLWMCVTLFRVFSFIVFAPFFPKRKLRKRQKRVVYEDDNYDPQPRKTRRRVAERSSIRPRQVRERAAPAAAPKQTVVEPSRNMQDTAIALKQLGYPKGQALELSEKVAAQIGRDAPLNDMIKLALQLTTRPQ